MYIIREFRSSRVSPPERFSFLCRIVNRAAQEFEIFRRSRNADQIKRSRRLATPRFRPPVSLVSTPAMFKQASVPVMGARPRILAVLVMFVSLIFLVSWRHLEFDPKPIWTPPHLRTEQQDQQTEVITRPPPPQRCSPLEWSGGSWVFRPPSGNGTSTGYPKVRKEQDGLVLLGYEKCASKRNYWWHLGVDYNERWTRFPGVASWKWVPGSQCSGFEERAAEWMIKELVEGGGWLLIGDSVTENHFFSLSCVLSHHIVVHDDRENDIFLDPESPLIDHLEFPDDFDIYVTPLISFHRVDLLISRDETVAAHRQLGGTLENATLFHPTELLWTESQDEYLERFFTPHPKGGYRTLIVNTAAHWTSHLFIGGHKPGIEGILELFRQGMTTWSKAVNAAMDRANAQPHSGRDFRTIVRSYTPGHNNCANRHYPMQEVEPYEVKTYNWDEIATFNDIMGELAPGPYVHYLPIDRPARLRPDAHVSADCLHLMAGTGVIEGWTQYIWHYLQKELTT